MPFCTCEDLKDPLFPDVTPTTTINDNGDDLLESKSYLDFEAEIKENLESNDYSSAALNLTMYTEDVVPTYLDS